MSSEKHVDHGFEGVFFSVVLEPRGYRDSLTSEYDCRNFPLATSMCSESSPPPDKKPTALLLAGCVNMRGSMFLFLRVTVCVVSALFRAARGRAAAASRGEHVNALSSLELYFSACFT